MFEDLWKTYPRKVAKKAAMQAWARLTKEQQDTAIKAIHTHVSYWERMNTEQQYIPHCSTWLNQWRFDDDLKMPKDHKNVQVAWWATEQTMLEKGRELGTSPRPGEGWNEFKGRLVQMIQRAA